jgi:hypothetical protein
MKTIKTLLVCTLLALTSGAFAQDFTMTFSDVNIEAGQTADLKVTFESNVTIAGWQMFLYLPQGIEIVYDAEEEEYAVALSDLHHKKHACEVTKASDGAMMLVMSGGTKTYEMSGNSGDLCAITLKAADTFSGSATVDVKKIRISDKSGVAYSQDDASFTITEGGTDGISSINADEQFGGAIYNLAGQKVSKAQKGVFIQNGRKVVMK